LPKAQSGMVVGRKEATRLAWGSTKVQCPSCGHEVGGSARFCGECGASLTGILACPHCAAENEPSQKFCSSCGHPLTGEAPVAAEPTAVRAAANASTVANEPAVSDGHSAPSGAGIRDPRAYTPAHLAEKILGARADLDGERKQVTVLFADVT